MRRAHPILLISLLVSSAASGQTTSTPATTSSKMENGSVAGMVVRKGSNEPIHFAQITLASDGDEKKACTVRQPATVGSPSKTFLPAIIVSPSRTMAM
jgi:hypothetical protein